MANQEESTMQFFMEMKKKFPELPEKIIHDCINRYPDNIAKCQECLIKESERYMYASINDSSGKPTVDIQSWTEKGDVHTSSCIPHKNETLILSGNHVIHHSPSILNGTTPSNLSNTEERRDSLEIPVVQNRQEARSAPVMPSEHIPFNYNRPYASQLVPSKFQYPSKSPTFLPHHVLNRDYSANIARPRKTEPTVASPVSDNSHIVTVSNSKSTTSTSQASHITSLNFTPAPPYLMDPPTPGRHKTSINVEVHPGEQQPYEISTYPHNVGSLAYPGYNSQVQISVSPTTTSITARRTQKPGMPLFQPNTPVHSTNQWHSPVSSPPSCSEPFSNIGNYSFLPHENIYYSPVTRSDRYGEHASSTHQTHWQHGMQPPFVYSSHTPDENIKPTTDVLDNIPENYKGMSYTQVLLQHQRKRLEMLEEVLNKERKKRAQLEQEIKTMEKELQQQRQNTFSDMEEFINKLKEEYRKLQVECQCLSFEIDQLNSSEVPLGITDEDFYKNIPTGQEGPIPPIQPQSLNKREVPSGSVQPSGAEEEEEKNKWKCSKCTFENHPALNKCEICEMARSGTNGDDTNISNQCYSAACTDSRFHPSSEDRAGTWPRRAVGHVQIRVTQNVAHPSTKSLSLSLTHRMGMPRR